VALLTHEGAVREDSPLSVSGNDDAKADARSKRFAFASAERLRLKLGGKKEGI